LVLWWWSRREILLAVFGADCGVRAAFCGVLVAVATAQTPAEAQRALRLRVSLGILMMLAWLWSLAQVSGVRARWFVGPVTALLLILFSLHAFVVPLNATVLAVEQSVM